MATTASGWPYVVPADHPLEYPAVSQALANKLESAGPFLRAALTANTAPLGTGAIQVPMTTVSDSFGTDLSLASGWVRANVAGRYLIGLSLTLASVPATGYQAIASIYRGGSPVLNATLARTTVATAGSWMTASGSLPFKMLANDEVRLVLAMNTAGVTVNSDFTQVWAMRIDA